MLVGKTQVVLRFLFFVLCIFGTQNSLAMPHDTLFTATFKGRHTGIGITMTKTLVQVDENRFVLRSKAKSLVGSITEESHFLIFESKLVPLSYQYYRKIFGKKSDQRLRFDWVEHTASFTRSDKPHRNKTFTIDKGTLDPSLYHIKLQQQLFHDEKPLSFVYAKDSGLRTMDFDFVEGTTYTLNDSDLAAVKIERINQTKDKATTITLVPELNYQIAQITHTDEDGSTYTIRLEDYEAQNEKLHAFYKRIATGATDIETKGTQVK